MECAVATRRDIPFICQTYNENIQSLHGAPRDHQAWERLLEKENTIYYIVSAAAPVAWFRLDEEDGGFWLGMLQVKPEHHRKGVGRYILSVAEGIAKEKGFSKLGIHTTQDNLAARGLYENAGYALTQIGPCTTADGVERVGYTFEKDLQVGASG